MKVIAGVYTVSSDQSQVTAYTERVQAGSLIALVAETSDGRLFFMNEEGTKVYGKGEVVSPALNQRMRATIAARREFGRRIVVG